MWVRGLQRCVEGKCQGCNWKKVGGKFILGLALHGGCMQIGTYLTHVNPDEMTPHRRAVQFTWGSA